LRATLANGLTVVSVFTKEKGSKNLDLTMEANPKYNLMLNGSEHKSLHEIYNNKFETIANGKINSVNVLQNVSANSWNSICSTGASAGGWFTCTIESKPTEYYYAPIIGVTLGVVDGSFATNSTMSELNTKYKYIKDNNSAEASGGGLIFVHIEGHDKNTKNLISWWNGGGNMVGGFDGEGYFSTSNKPS